MKSKLDKKIIVFKDDFDDDYSDEDLNITNSEIKISRKYKRYR